MAKMSISPNMDKYMNSLDKFGSKTPEITKKMVRAGANPVADEIRKGLEKNIADIASVSKNPTTKTMRFKTGPSTGSLASALGISPASVDSNGNTNVKVGFDGYDKNGVPNALKARAMESGTSRLKKRPFVRPAVSKAKNKAISEMERVYQDELKIYAL